MPLGRDDVVDAVDEDREVLELGPEHVLGEDAGGIAEDAPEEVAGETLGDAVAEAARLHGPALVDEILALLQVSAGDEVFRFTLGRAHPRPDLGDEQGDVVVDAVLRADPGGGGGQRGVSGEQVRDEGVVEVDDRGDGVERTLGERALGAGPGGRGRLPGEAGDRVHEELGQLLVVDRTVDAERPDAGVGRVVAPAREDGVDGHRHVASLGDAAVEPGAELGEVAAARVEEVGAELEVAGVLRGAAVDEAGMGGGDRVGGILGGDERAQEPLHRLGELVETDRLLDHARHEIAGERFVVGEEVPRPGEVGLGVLVVAADDRVVGPLEEPGFAVRDELPGEALLRGREPLDGGGRGDGGGGDVVLGLHLGGRHEVAPEAERAPRSVGREADAEVAGEELDVAVLELVTGVSVDEVGGEALPPVPVPVGLVDALDDEDEVADALRDRGQPVVVLSGVFRTWSQELDDGAERAFGAQDRPAARPVAGRVAEAAAVLPADDPGDVVEVGLEVLDEDRAGDHRVGDRLGDLGLPAAGDRAGFVAERALGGGADEPPAAHGGRLDHLDLVAGGQHVGAAREQAHLDGAALVGPADGFRLEAEGRILRHVADAGEGAVDRVAVGEQLHPGAVALHQVGETVIDHRHVLAEPEVLAEVVGGEGDGAARVFLLGLAVEVGGVADLGFDLLLAVAEVGVGDERDDHPAIVAAGDLEGAAVVVAFVLPLPTHPVAPLARGRLRDVGQAEVAFARVDEVRSEDHAAGLAGPAADIEAGVVVGEERIAGVAEDRLDEIEVGDEPARGEETDLEGLLRAHPGDRRADDRSQEERDPEGRLVPAPAGEGQAEQVARRLEGDAEERGEDRLGHGLLVGGYGQPLLGDVEDALGRAAVLLGIVEDALGHAVGVEGGALVGVAIGGQAEHAGEAGAVEGERLRGYHRSFQREFRTQVGAEETVDRPVGRAEVALEQARLLLVVRKKRFAEREVGEVLLAAVDRLAHRGELEVDELDQPGIGGGAGFVRHGGKREGLRTNGRLPAEASRAQPVRSVGRTMRDAGLRLRAPEFRG